MIDLFIAISLIIFAGGFFWMGYWLGYKNAETVYSFKLNGGKVYKRAVVGENVSKGDLVMQESSSAAVDEPSGVIYRPSAAELKKMNEDQVTKEVKEAMRETFDNAPEVIA